MSRGTRLFAAILCLVAIASFAAYPFWKRLKLQPVSAALYERTKALVDKNPRLKPEWDKAMEDGVLTFPEAKHIIESAGEKVESQQ
jgi:hypothetical protein